jgi:hypothetical protein
MKFSRKVIPLKMTSLPYFNTVTSISNGGMQTSEVGAEFEPYKAGS